jgi:hypothetical protein
VAVQERNVFTIECESIPSIHREALSTLTITVRILQ